jgi:hypothetical protein
MGSDFRFGDIEEGLFETKPKHPPNRKEDLRQPPSPEEAPTQQATDNPSQLLDEIKPIDEKVVFGAEGKKEIAKTVTDDAEPETRHIACRAPGCSYRGKAEHHWKIHATSKGHVTFGWVLSDEPGVMENAEDYTSMTVVQLKALLKEHDLPVSGKKADLVARLQDAAGADETPKEESDVFTWLEDFIHRHEGHGLATETDALPRMLEVSETLKVLQQENESLAHSNNVLALLNMEVEDRNKLAEARNKELTLLLGTSGVNGSLAFAMMLIGAPMMLIYAFDFAFWNSSICLGIGWVMFILIGMAGYDQV